MGIIDEAFASAPRENFLPPEEAPRAGLDMPLPIGYGQTNSQPTTVRLMLKWLDVRPGQKVLDVGSGSGWTTALLAFLTGEKGRVVAVEKVPELVDFGRANCRRLGIKNVVFHQAGEVFGRPEDKPFDRILVSAAAGRLPDELTGQLAPGGRMVVPVRGDVLVVTKDKYGKLNTDTHAGFMFVPLLPK